MARRGSDVLLGVAMAALASALLAYLPGAFSVDSWLALVTGREVWQTGLPHTETLTALAHGHVWIDQQWLSQLISYGLYLGGGLGLLGLVNVLALVAGIAGAIAGARRLGAPAKAVMAVLPLCLWLLIPSREVRTQALVIPLFTGLIYLLARDSRAPSRRVYLCLPLLVLWANLHGTVTLGAGLVVLRALTLAYDRRAEFRRAPAAWRRPLILIVGAPLAMLVTPYGVGILGYLHTMFLGSTVRDAVTEWQPVTSAFIVAWPFFFTAGLALWAFGRDRARHTTAFEKLALIALAAGSILVIRNLLFFSLTALLVLPAALGMRHPDQAGSGNERARRTINLGLALAAAATLLLTAAATLVRPASAYELSYQRIPLLHAVQRAVSADPHLEVLADVRFADWLLWRDPALSGRVANDARFELLSAPQTQALQRVNATIGLNWKQGAAGYGLIVLDRRYTPDAVLGFEQERGRRVLYDDGQRVVILRPGSAMR